MQVTNWMVQAQAAEIVMRRQIDWLLKQGYVWVGDMLVKYDEKGEAVSWITF